MRIAGRAVSGYSSPICEQKKARKNRPENRMSETLGGVICNGQLHLVFLGMSAPSEEMVSDPEPLRAHLIQTKMPDFRQS